MNNRLTSVEDIQQIMFNVEITIRFSSDDNDKTTFKKVEPKTSNTGLRKLNLILYMNHFMPNIPFKTTEYYIQHFEELDKTNDPNRFHIIDDSVKTNRSSVPLVKLIKLLIKHKAVIPIPSKQQLKLASLYEHFRATDFNIIPDACFRPLIIRPKNKDWVHLIQNDDLMHLFGRSAPKEQYNTYLHKLQKIIDSFNVKINVHEVPSYTHLMERLMYETGCFDNVYDITGPIADRIRAQPQHPAPHTANGYPFYSNQKLYYIDINGAYLSTVASIPTGRCGHDLVFELYKTKIKDVIERLYCIRQEDKPIDLVLANCLKLMTNCSWGMSIRRPRRVKETSAKDQEKFISENEPYVVEICTDSMRYIWSINVC